MQLPEDDLRIETCWSDFKSFNVKFYVSALVGVLTKVKLHDCLCSPSPICLFAFNFVSMKCMLHCNMAIQQMYEKEFAMNMSLRGCHQISSEIVGHVVEVSHYYLSVSVQTFISGAFSYILHLFCHIFLSNISL